MTDWRGLRRMIGVDQLRLSQRSGVSKARLSGAEAGYWALEAGEAKALREALADMARERSAALFVKLREAADT